MLLAVLLVAEAIVDAAGSVVDEEPLTAPHQALALPSHLLLLRTRMRGVILLLQKALRPVTGQLHPNLSQRPHRLNRRNLPHQLSLRRRRGPRCSQSLPFLHPFPLPRSHHLKPRLQKSLVLHQVRSLITLKLHTRMLNLKNSHNQ